MKRYTAERELENPLAAVQMGLIYVLKDLMEILTHFISA
jgi:catalase (peroxidase I)